MNKVIFSVIYGVLYTAAYADNSITAPKQQAMVQIESAFAIQTTPYNDMTQASQNTWPAGVDVDIDNTGRFTFKSKSAIKISLLTISINDIRVDNKVDLELEPNVVSHWFFNSQPLKKAVFDLEPGFKLLGAYKQITADSFADYRSYRYRIAKVGITWTDAKKTYNQSFTNFIVLFVK